MILMPPKLKLFISFPDQDYELMKQERGWKWVSDTGCFDDTAPQRCYTIVEAIRYAWILWPGCEVLETNAEGHFVKNGPWVVGAAKVLMRGI